MTEEKKSIPFDSDFDMVAAPQRQAEKEEGFFAQIPSRLAFYMGLVVALLVFCVVGLFILFSLVV